MKNKEIQKYHDKLLREIQKLYQKNFKGKVPITLSKLCKDLLLKFPKNVFFKAIEIKTYNEKSEKELDNCFPGNFYTIENEGFKTEIYRFLYGNLKDYENNQIIIKGICTIINNLDKKSFIKKYIKLIDIIAQPMNEEERVICELLASNPLKYKELSSFVHLSLSLSPLPKTAKDFYAINNYEKNVSAFIQFSRNDSIGQLRQDFFKKISLQDEKISRLNEAISSQNVTILSQNEKILNLSNEITKLKKESKATKTALFNVQLRDVINAFLGNLCWALHVKKTDNYVSDVEDALKNIDGKETNGGKMIIKLLNNLGNLKQSGNDEGHYFKNIGFDLNLLPDEIKEKYEKYKIKANCGIKSCDCIALLLSIREINDSPECFTKIKYDFLDRLLEIPVRDWDNNKFKVLDLLNSYGNSIF